MKSLALVLLLTMVPALASRAQSISTNQVPTSPVPTNPVPAAKVEPQIVAAELPPFFAPATNAAPQVIHRRFTYEGAIPQARRSRNPLQLINPFAPVSEGSGLNNVAVNPRTGRAEGISLFSVRF